MNTPNVTDLSTQLGTRVTDVRRIAGGDINDAFRVLLADRSALFIKSRAGAPAGMYAREAEGLAWLAEAGALRTPRVVLASDALLALEWITPAARKPDFDEQLGRGLARLHQRGAPCFGLASDNSIGPLVQVNTACASWSDFYRSQRLQPLIERAGAAGLLRQEHRRALERLLAKLDTLVGPSEPPARLHGDLWSGNVHVDERGAPVLIDPAVYGGHREIDLAMLSLFGSPSPRFYAAYDEVYPRAEGHAERVALYQIYPLLVHLSLFGHGYLDQLRSAVSRYV
jgi:fructosamine-3-kinase